MTEFNELTRLGSRAVAAMLAGASHLHTRFLGDSALVASGEDSPMLNRLSIAAGEDPARFLGECVEIARARGYPLMAGFTPDIAAGLTGQAQRLGLAPLGQMPLMVLRPKTDLAVPEGDCTVRRATELPAVEAVVGLLNRSVASSGGVPIRAFMRTLDVGSTAERGLGIFLGSRDGVPMSTVTAVQAGETVGFWRMATAPEAQRKGIGRALLAQVTNLYRERGATRFYLSASEAGRPLYESLGFETIGQYAVWRFGG